MPDLALKISPFLSVFGTGEASGMLASQWAAGRLSGPGVPEFDWILRIQGLAFRWRFKGLRGQDELAVRDLREEEEEDGQMGMDEEELPVGIFPAASLENKSILALKAINACIDNV